MGNEISSDYTVCLTVAEKHSIIRNIIHTYILLNENIYTYYVLHSLWLNQINTISISRPITTKNLL